MFQATSDFTSNSCCKDRTKVEDQTGVVYRIPCGGCNKVYVGETKRSVGESIKEHTAKVANNPSAVAEHHQKTGHEPDLDNVKVLCREDILLPRKVREAIFIKKETSPTFNRDGGVNFQKFQFTSRNTKNYKNAANGEFRKWISQSEFSYHPLRTEKGFSETLCKKRQCC